MVFSSNNIIHLTNVSALNILCEFLNLFYNQCAEVPIMMTNNTLKLPLINADLTWVMTESSFSPLYELPGYSLLLLKDFASGQINPVGSTWVYLKDFLRFSSLQQKKFFFFKKFQSFHVFSYISINWFCYLSREFLSASFGKFSYTAATYLHVMLLFFTHWSLHLSA